MDLDNLSDEQLAALRYELLDDRNLGVVSGRAVDELLAAVEVEIIARWLWARFRALTNR